MAYHYNDYYNPRIVDFTRNETKTEGQPVLDSRISENIKRMFHQLAGKDQEIDAFEVQQLFTSVLSKGM